MAKIPAPAATAALRQATAKWKTRSKALDGIVPSAAHTRANPRSDHEPGRYGMCRAWDLTHDPGDGCDTEAIADKLAYAVKARKERRVKYIIQGKRIFSRKWNGWAWRSYSGIPHTNHMHVSLLDVRSLLRSTAPWPGIATTVIGAPTLKLGARGYYVKRLQTKLTKKGYKVKVDGVFGATTKKQVVAFQKKHCRVIRYGVVGKRTWKALG